MRKRWAGVVVAAAVLCLGATKPPAIGVPEGWGDVSTKGVCAIQRGAVAIATSDGLGYALAIEGPKIGRPEIRSLRIGEESFSLAFEKVEGGIAAGMPPAAVAALREAAVVEAEWLPGGRADLPSLEAAFPALRACGQYVARQDAEKRARRADFADRLSRAGAILRDNPPSRSGGGTCFHEREWVSGFNRNCVYDCLTGEVVQTVASTALCPLTINR